MMAEAGSTVSRRKKRRKKREPQTWQSAFLASLAVTGNVSVACAAIRVGKKPINRRRVYRERERNAEFRERMDEVNEVAVDELESSAFARARDGWLEPVWRDGARAVDVDGEPASVRKYSDALTIFMLKKRRPKIYSDDARGGGSMNAQEYAQKALAALREINSLAGSEPSVVG